MEVKSEYQEDNGTKIIRSAIQGRVSQLIELSSGFEKGMLSIPHDVEIDGKRVVTTALIEAARVGQYKAAFCLLTCKADINFARPDDGVTALIMAARKGHENVAELLLERNACLHSVDSNGHTALHEAVAGGYTSMVKLVLEARANADSRDVAGTTALMAACEQGHLEVVKELLLKGANPEIEDKKGTTAMMIAEVKGDRALYRLLEDALPKHYSVFLKACRMGNEALVAQLLSFGVKVNFRDSTGMTALLYAAQGGHGNIISLLLQHGADISICRFVNFRKETASTLAQQFGHTKLAIRLINIEDTIREAKVPSIEALKRVGIKSIEEATCVICNDVFIIGDRVSKVCKFGCPYWSHETCMLSYLHTTSRCRKGPTCEHAVILPLSVQAITET